MLLDTSTDSRGPNLVAGLILLVVLVVLLLI